MAICIMCGKPVDNYPGYITDGVIAVCNNCASSNSLMRVMTRIENSGKTANLKSVFTPLIEISLVNQTDGERVELDKNKLDAKRELNKKYGMAFNAYTDEELEDIEAYEAKYQPGSEFMDGAKHYLESGLVNQTDSVSYDIENMSQDDFYSKYADNQVALNMWHDYHGEPSDFLEV